MKHISTRIAILSAGLFLMAKAAPIMAVGDNAELFLTAGAQIQFDDNIYMDNTGEKSDTIYSFTPGVDLVFGKGSVTTGNVFFKEEFRRFSTNDKQNTQLANFGINSNYDNGVTKAGFNASYAEVAQNDNNLNPVGSIVDRKLTNLGAKTEFGITEKTTLGVGLSFEKTDYAPTVYVDSSVWTLPVDVYFKASPKLDWSVGYRYRSTDLSGTGNDNSDNNINIGARGEFTPKLTGQVRFGYTKRSFDVGGDDDQFSFDSNLAFAVSDKTKATIFFSNDFGNTGFGDSTKVFTLGANASNKLNEQLTFTGGLTYKKYDYPTRKDDYLEGQLAVSYAYNSFVNFGASYTYRDNSSGNASAEFTNNVFSFGANVRY